MHPDLRPSNLDSLPIARRRLLKSVMTSSPSKTTLEGLSAAIEQSFKAVLRGSFEINDFLPAFYVLIDPARIPPIAALESLNSDDDTWCILWGAVLSLQGIVGSCPSSGSFSELWPRMVPWSHFLFTYEGFLTTTMHLNPLDKLWVTFMGFCATMCDRRHNKSLLLSTPDCCVLAYRAWRRISDDNDFVNHDITLWMIHEIIAYGDLSPPLDDVLEGISGTLADLACLIMRQCEVGVRLADAEPSLQTDKISVMEYAFRIVARIDRIEVGSKKILSYPLCFALLPLGFMKTLIVTILGLCTVPPPCKFLEYCLVLLVAIFETDNNRDNLRIAIKQGLLDALLTVSRRGADLLSDVLHRCLRWLVLDFLAPSTVYFGILVYLQKAILEISKSALASIPVDNLAQAWHIFFMATSERLDAGALFDSRTIESMSVCGNRECGVIATTNIFKCCSGCRAVNYCSRECQTLDWRACHRLFCAQYQTNSIRLRRTYTRKENAFLRFLLHQDYTLHKYYLAENYAHALAVKRDARFLSLFDYSCYPVKVHKIEVDDSRPTEPHIAGSTGFMDRIILRMPDSSEGHRDWIFRLARGNATVSDELKNIACKGTLTSPEGIREEIKRVLALEGPTAITIDV
ncbi:hypothetical protein R3P38DRAFT_3042268 [Favolaschia claudopus]|uniref:MYND-type domain-containing protein n=1 Tax=Favolaschia claudopus TaxID=2862362 RepID=A0AAW0A7Z1_9AGAR